MKNNNLKILIVYIIAVIIISASLTIIYSLKNNSGDDKTLKIDVDDANKEYLVDDNKIKISTFSVIYEKNEFKVNFLAENTSDTLVESISNYRIYLYDNDKNVIKEYDSSVLRLLTEIPSIECNLYGKYDGRKIASIEIVKEE